MASTSVPMPKGVPLSRSMRRVLTYPVALLLLSGVVEAGDFASHVLRAQSYEACRPGVSPWPSFNAYLDYQDAWGQLLFGFKSGAYHCYGGPGAAYLRFGLGDLVFDVEFPMCALAW